MQQGDKLWSEDQSLAVRKYIEAIKIARVKKNWQIESVFYYKLSEHLLEGDHYTELAKLGEIASSRAQEVGDWDEAAEYVLWA